MIGRIPLYLSEIGLNQASIFFQKIFCLIDANPQRQRVLQFLVNKSKLRSRIWSGEQNYPVFVINRDCDRDRLSRFEHSCKVQGLSFERVRSVDNEVNAGLLKMYDNKISHLCYNRNDFNKGIFSAFLSHRKAWTRVFESNSDWGMVCEDDAVFLGGIPKKIQDYGIPEGCEMLFCNQRMAEGVMGTGVSENGGNLFRFFSAGQALEMLHGIHQPITGPGGDCYLLSKQGAGKLLEIFDSMRMAFDVDWFLLFHTINDAAVESFLETDRTGRFNGYVPNRLRLSGYVLVPSLVEQAGGESKVRRREFCTREELFC